MEAIEATAARKSVVMHRTVVLGGGREGGKMPFPTDRMLFVSPLSSPIRFVLKNLEEAGPGHASQTGRHP
jgi:hypothetical protein